VKGMWSYFARRLLLIPVTFVCITFLVYSIMRLAPGGPIEQAQLEARARMTGEGGGGGGFGGLRDTGDQSLPPEAIKQLERYYKLDRPIPVGYLIRLGLWPDDQKGGRFSGIVEGDFGTSYRYSEPVVKRIVSKFPISVYFGLIGYFATWIVCVPLGVKKALEHRSLFDTVTSVFVFLAYSTPGYVAALLLLLFLATDMGFDIFPLGQFRSDGWDEWWKAGEYWRCVKDQLWHTAIPIAGYLVANFATMTILMKNSLLENLSADYVRTAFAQGISEPRVIYIHTLRNSLIPMCVGIGHALGVLFAGSFLIERMCNIPGMGLLGYMSVIERDYPVSMGILVFIVLIGLTGSLISDFILALVDPRVRFG
jgi:microcin C transport system permease protein